MLKTRAILCGLACIGLAVGLLGCSDGDQEQANNPGGVTAPLNESPAAKLVREKGEALNNTEWDIEIAYKIGTTKKKEQNKLRFVSNKVYIEKFKDEGYRASSYSLSIESDGVVVWETRQTSEDGSTLSMRGDWRGKKMSGSIVRYPKDGERQTFGFTSTASRKI